MDNLIKKLAEKHYEILKEYDKYQSRIELVMTIDSDELPFNENVLPIYGDIIQLKELLEKKYNLNFPNETIVNIIYHYVDEIDLQKIKKKQEFFDKIILTYKPKNKEDYVDALLKQYGEKYEGNIHLLTILMNKKDIYYNSIESLTNFIKNRKKMIELENFEKSLLNEKSEKEKIDQSKEHDNNLKVIIYYFTSNKLQPILELLNSSVSSNDAATIINCFQEELIQIENHIKEIDSCVNLSTKWKEIKNRICLADFLFS